MLAVLSSPVLAISLLVAVLACCLVGVTLLTAADAWERIFTTLWFNALLVLLAVSSGVTFLARTWGRKLSVLHAGMILFHVSFLSLLGGVVYNGLFRFEGIIRLTEGETLRNSDPASYDTIQVGRFFDFARLRGETTLLKLHWGYQVDGQDKRAAYEIAVGEAGRKVSDKIYVTQNLTHDGVRYLVEKEGYSVGVALVGDDGQDLYAAMVPLQSHGKPGGKFEYTTGSANAREPMRFPAAPEQARFLLDVSYVPRKTVDREGEVTFRVRPLDGGAAEEVGRAPVGGRVKVGRWTLEAREVRYWVGMVARHDPGLMTVLTSLWAGFAGMTLIFVGRILQDSRRAKRAVGPGDSPGPVEGA